MHDFGGLTQAVRDISPLQISVDTAKKAVNRAYQTLLRSRPGGGAWFGIWKSTVFSSQVDKTNGTITVREGLDTIQGVGTSFALTDVGRFLVIGGRQPLRINSYTDPLTLGLQQNWGEPTILNTPYQIMTLRYPLPEDCDRVLRLTGPTWFLQRRPLTLIDAYDPTRQQRGVPLIFNEVESLLAQAVVSANPKILNGTVAVTASSQTAEIRHNAHTTNYSVSIETSWNTTSQIVQKHPNFVELAFGVPAPVGGTFDWIVVVTGASPQTLSTFTRIEIELWPVPDQPMTFALHYRKRVPDLVADSDVPVIAGEAVMWAATSEQAMKMYSRTGDPTYLQQAQVYTQSLGVVLDHILREDRRIRGAHPVVQDAEDGVFVDSPAFLQAMRQFQTMGLAALG